MEKIYPIDVESGIQEMNNVAEVTVYGEKNLITGNIVCSRIRLINEENQKEFKSKLLKHCSNRN
jgi:acyl-coenzyme A synthetase/AMP-(fatty) acid ligase